MPKGVPLTPEEQAARQQEIVAIAMRIFREKGFQQTSMREIAQAAKMGKSSLYDFFQTKDEILVFALEDEMTDIIENAQAIACLDDPPDVRLKKIMEANLGFMRKNGTLIPWLNTETQNLDKECQKRLQVKHYSYQDTVKSVIEEGVSNGRFRNVNTLLAARLLINSLLTVVSTTRPTGSAEEMLGEVIEIFLNGIKE